MKFLNIFSIFVVNIFALLNSNPYSADQHQCGSGSTTLKIKTCNKNRIWVPDILMPGLDMIPEIVPAIGLILAVRRSRASQQLPAVGHPVPLQGQRVQRRELTVLATQFQPVGEQALPTLRKFGYIR
jgi:hypothetical protein